MRIRPTKTWLKEHPPSKFCPWKETGCRCTFTMIDEDKYGVGFCVGILPEVEDLDIVRICSNQPSGDTVGENVFRVVVQATPIEVLWFAIHIQVAVSNVFQLDPQYRSMMGKMRSRKTRILNKLTARGGKS